jgi:hypothetical protein
VGHRMAAPARLQGVHEAQHAPAHHHYRHPRSPPGQAYQSSGAR